MKIGSKRISTSFTVILILLLLIAGAFIYKYLTRPKYQILAANTAVTHPHKKHKRKHTLNNNMAAVDLKSDAADTVQTPPQAESKPVPVKKPDSSKTNIDFLYTTYVQPNATGIVKLREQDKFYSNTITNIPANSLVRVLKKGSIYYKVLYNNSVGFVPRWALQIK